MHRTQPGPARCATVRRRTPASGTRVRRSCSPGAGGESRGYVRPRPSSRLGRRCRGNAPGRRRSRRAAAHGRSAPASHARDGACTATALASRGCAQRRAGAGTGSCWSADAAGQTAPRSPSQSSGRAPRTSAPVPRTPPAPATGGDDERHSAPSRPSPATHRGSGASASTPETEPPRAARQCRPELPREPPHVHAPTRASRHSYPSTGRKSSIAGNSLSDRTKAQSTDPP